jgi:hypothetical protein
MHENRHFDAWIEGVHFHLGACAETRTWYAHAPDRSIRFAGVAGMDVVVPTIRMLLHAELYPLQSANDNGLRALRRP